MSEQREQDLSELTLNSNFKQQSADELRKEGVTLLGSGHTEYKDTYDPSIIQTFENKYPDRDYVVTFDALEGTSLCPITHQPDFFKMIISYIPGPLMLESKSLKLLLFSWRNTGSYHETIVNTVMEDIRDRIQPKFICVRGIFSVRGGIAIYPQATWANPEYPEYVELEKQMKLAAIRDAANRTMKYDM